MTTNKEISELLANGWEMTDPSCNQMRKEIIEDEMYAFREDRIINPETKETGVYEDELCYDAYDWNELVEACESFGYTAKQVDKWIAEGAEIALMLECIFELSN
jgi:hypothetical protein